MLLLLPSLLLLLLLLWGLLYYYLGSKPRIHKMKRYPFVGEHVSQSANPGCR